MPYNLNIKTKYAGTTKVTYNVIAAMKHTEVPEEVLKQLEDETPVQIVLNSMKDKAKKQHEGEPEVDYPDDDINPEDIPF